MLKVNERKRQVEVKTYLFTDSDQSKPSNVSISNDSGIDMDPFSASSGRPRTDSEVSSHLSSQPDLTDGLARTLSESSDCQLFITNTDTDSAFGAEGYQVKLPKNRQLILAGKFLHAHRDYKRIEAASGDESRDKLNKSNGGKRKSRMYSDEKIPFLSFFARLL